MVFIFLCFTFGEAECVVRCVWEWRALRVHAVNQRDWKNNSLALASIPLLWRLWRLTVLESLRSYCHMAALLCNNKRKEKGVMEGKTQGLLKWKCCSNKRQWYFTASSHYYKYYYVMHCRVLVHLHSYTVELPLKLRLICSRLNVYELLFVTECFLIIF